MSSRAEQRRTQRTWSLTHQKNRCFPEVMSMYPEYCCTEGSQILGLVTLRL